MRFAPRSKRKAAPRSWKFFASAPLDALVERDVKGLYKKAIAGEIKNFTGVSDPYEEPLTPEIVALTSAETVEASAQRILDYLTEKQFIGR